MCLALMERLPVGPLCHKAPTGGGLQWWLTFYNFLPSPEWHLWSSATWSLGSSLPLSPRLFSPIAQFGRTASSRKGSGRPKRLPFSIMEAHCALRNLKCSRIFFVTLARICALPQFCLWALQAVPLTSWFSLLWHALWAVRSYIDRCVAFLIKSNQYNQTQLDSNEGVEPSQGWSEKWTAPELNIWVSQQRVWILRTMWYFSFSFLINLQKCQQFCVFLSIWGAVCTLMRKKKWT